VFHCQTVRQTSPVQFQLWLPDRDKPLHKLPEEVLLILVNSLYKHQSLTADIPTQQQQQQQSHYCDLTTPEITVVPQYLLIQYLWFQLPTAQKKIVKLRK
jgi:hypothetical protein